MNQNILVFLGHPAHFHLFKHTIAHLRSNGNRVDIVIKKKDILEDLLDRSGVEYTNLLPNGRENGTLGILKGMLRKDIGIYRHCRLNRPDIMFGTSAEIAHVGKLLGIPSIIFEEDDVAIIRAFAAATYPFADHILSPVSCNNGRWNKKTVFYEGYHKLAYLHPNRFQPDINIVRKYFPNDEPYFLLRFANLTAHHDNGIKGFNDAIALRLIRKLEKKGNVYISSERVLAPEFEPYALHIDVLDIHHILAFAQLFVGDSQSMAVEAAMLGTPSVRFSGFSGRIGVLEELEKKYGLTYGIKPDNHEQLFMTVNNLIEMHSLPETFQERRKRMLSDKIDVTAFFQWFIGNYPESYSIMKNDTDYQERFKTYHNENHLRRRRATAVH